MISKNVQDTEQFAHEFLSKLTPKADIATVVALSGDLGSGKTAFVKSAAKYFGLPEEVTSPTFVILKRFAIPSDNTENGKHFAHLIHIDAYRLESEEELDRLRFKELLGDPKNIIFIEWPERVADLIPKDALRLTFTFIDEATREIKA